MYRIRPIIRTTGLLPAGIYEAHLTGVDMHNLNAWRFNNYLLGVCDDGTPCAPVLHPFTIGDTVWNDLNGNGIQDDGEPGIPGVTVTLLDLNGEPIPDMTATTEANGQYQFNVDAGTYSVQIDSSNFDSGGALAGYVSTTGGDSQTNTVTTDNVLTYDFGYNPPATIGDFVWNDINGNGIQDSGEPGLPDVSVTLLGSDGTTVVTSTTTDASGNYSFTNLPGGTYFLQFTAPSGSVFTAMNVAGSTSDNDSNADVTTGLTDAITLTPGATDNTIDAGLKQLLSFTCPNNLVQNPSFELNTGSPPKFWTNGTAGPINVPVVDGNNAGYISGRGSMYQKINVTSGNSYSLNFFSGSHNPSIQTVKLQYFDSHNRTVGSASVHTITSDLEVSGFGGPYTLTLGAAPSNATYLEIMVSANNQDYAKVDALCLQTTTAPATAAIGDFIWNDINGNGIQETGEPGVQGVTVQLLGSDGTTVVTTTTTDASGNYSFINLPAGTYYVQFNAPSGLTFTTKNAAGSTTANDSNVNVGTGSTDAITLATGATDNTIDAGLKQLLSFTCPNNLVLNPSFELNTGSPPKFWTNGTAGPINVPVVDGNNAGYISGRGSMYQKVNVTSGNSYSLTFFSGSHVPSIQTVKLQYFDSHNRTVGSASVHTITSDLEVSGFGGPYTLTLGAAPSNATYLEIMVSANNQDYAKVDALCLQADTTGGSGSTPPALQSVTSPGMT